MRYKIFGELTGLKVSELAIGAGKFGQTWGYGAKGRFRRRRTTVAARALARPDQDTLLQRVEKRLRVLQIGSLKTLTEAIVHRLQKAACLGDPTLIMLQAGKACGCSQLPRQGVLPARPTERAQKVLLGRRRRLRRTLPQNEFAFDAQEFGDTPALLVALGSRERLVDCRKSLDSFTDTTEGVRNLSEEWSVKEAKRVLRDAGERGAEKLQPGASVATLDEQYAREASTPDVPQVQRMPGGKIHERLYVALRQGQIAHEKRDQAG